MQREKEKQRKSLTCIEEGVLRRKNLLRSLNASCLASFSLSLEVLFGYLINFFTPALKFGVFHVCIQVILVLEGEYSGYFYHCPAHNRLPTTRAIVEDSGYPGGPVPAKLTFGVLYTFSSAGPYPVASWD